jgi:hypothetical protein
MSRSDVKNGQKAERKRAALLCEQITKQKHDHYDVDFVGWRVERVGIAKFASWLYPVRGNF